MRICTLDSGRICFFKTLSCHFVVLLGLFEININLSRLVTKTVLPPVGTPARSGETIPTTTGLSLHIWACER